MEGDGAVGPNHESSNARSANRSNRIECRRTRQIIHEVFTVSPLPVQYNRLYLMELLRHTLTPTDEASALAVVLVGLLPRLQFATKEAGDDRCQQALRALEERVLPALVRQVLQPHLQGRNRRCLWSHMGLWTQFRVSADP